MATVTLNPHLVAEMYDILFPKAFRSDSGPYDSYDDTYPPRVYTYQRVPARRLLKFALQNKVAYCRFLYFLKTNFTLRFRKRLSYLQPFHYP
uniref:Uncharacterized protein n=1 Tax=Panagrellus redivivus TaxID=6233 RepID=A0A7E5A120_PANRE